MAKKYNLYKGLRKYSKKQGAFEDIRRMAEGNSLSDYSNINSSNYTGNTAEIIEKYSSAANDQQISFKSLVAGFKVALTRMENIVVIVNGFINKVGKETAERKKNDKDILAHVECVKKELSKTNVVLENIAYIFEENLDIDIYGSRKKIKKQLKKIKKNSRIIGTYVPPEIVDLTNHKDGGC